MTESAHSEKHISFKIYSEVDPTLISLFTITNIALQGTSLCIYKSQLLLLSLISGIWGTHARHSTLQFAESCAQLLCSVVHAMCTIYVLGCLHYVHNVGAGWCTWAVHPIYMYNALFKLVHTKFVCVCVHCSLASEILNLCICCLRARVAWTPVGCCFGHIEDTFCASH